MSLLLGTLSAAPPSYLWRVARAGIAVATLAAVQPQDYATAKPQAWPYGAGATAASSGVIPGQLPTQFVQVKSEPQRIPAPQSWPYGRVVAVAQPPQSFHFWKAEAARVTIEPEQVRQPAIWSWPFGTSVAVAQATQPFHFFRAQPSNTVDAEGFRLPPPQAWPWNRFAQPFQPLMVFPPRDSLRLEVESLRLPTAQVWPYGRTVSVSQPSQPFSLWFNQAPVRLEPEQVVQPTRLSWPYGSVIAGYGSGVIPAQLPTQLVQVRAEPQRIAPPQSWPFGRTIATAQQTQPFSIWYRPAKPTIEPEQWTIPNLYGLMVVGGAVQPQSFHFFKAQPSVRVEPEGYRQPAPLNWPWNRFAQPFQPLLIWRPTPLPTVEAERYGIPPPKVWPYGMALPVAQQPFTMRQAFASLRLEAEAYRVPPPATWAHARIATAQSWNWWQIAPAEKTPDTTQFYEYRSRNFGNDWRLYRIVSTYVPWIRNRHTSTHGAGQTVASGAGQTAAHGAGQTAAHGAGLTAARGAGSTEVDP